MNRKALALAGLALTSVWAQSPVGFQGSIRGEDGKPIAGAVLRYQRLVKAVRIGDRWELSRAESRVNASASADERGAFGATGLPTGDYLLCAAVPSAAYLDPCQWSGGHLLTLTSGATARPEVVLKKGVFLKVRVDDPKGLLPLVKAGPMSAGNLIIGVHSGNGAFHAAENTALDRTGRNYELVVPANAPLKLWVFSRHVTLTDEKGVPLESPGASIPFQAAPGQDARFTVKVAEAAAGAR